MSDESTRQLLGELLHRINQPEPDATWAKHLATRTDLTNDQLKEQAS